MSLVFQVYQDNLFVRDLIFNTDIADLFSPKLLKNVKRKSAKIAQRNFSIHNFTNFTVFAVIAILKVPR